MRSALRALLGPSSATAAQRGLPGACAACRRALHTPPAPKPYLVTTPVYYANASPHIGHLYTSLLADAYARHARLQQACQRSGDVPRGVLLSMGTDEHGQKVAAAAAGRGVTPLAWCDAVSRSFAECAAAFDVRAGAFTRTTAQAHGRVVRWMWRRLAARGHIYLGKHEGWYCASEEAFLTPLQLCTRKEYLERRGLSAAPPAMSAAGAGAGATAAAAAAAAAATAGEEGARVSAESGHPVEWVSEDNYKFRLTAFAQQLQQLYADTTPGLVLPRERLTEVAAFVASGELRDLSVSRTRDRVAWAWLAPLEGPAATPQQQQQQQQQHSIYVWLDALCSYLTAALAPQYAAAAAGHSSAELPDAVPWETLFPAWPADLHVVGKDIVKFHALYWPAFLMAAGMPLPRLILAHGHFTVGRQKMSKSLGNCIDPMALLLPPPADSSVQGGGAAAAAAAAPAPAAGGAAKKPSRATAAAAAAAAAAAPSSPAAPPPTTTPPAAPPNPLMACLGGPYTVDGVRFALLREGIVAEDGDFNPSTLEQRASKECADTFGNLASRLLTTRFMPVEGCITVAPIALALPWEGVLAQAGLRDPRGAAAGGGGGGGDALGHAAAAAADPSLHPAAQRLPLTEEQAALLASVDALGLGMDAAMDKGLGPAPGLAAIVAALQEANRVFTRAEPWKRVAKQEEVAAWRGALEAVRGGSGSGSGSSAVLLLPPGHLTLQPHTLELAALNYTLAETLRVCAILLQLVTPRAAGLLLTHLGLPPAPYTAAPFDGTAFSGSGAGGGHHLAQWDAARVGAARPHDIRIASTPLAVLFPKARV